VMPPGIRFGPIADGWLLPSGSPTLVSDVPTVIGLNADEGSFSANYSTQSAEQKNRAREQGMAALGQWAENRAKTARTRAYLYFFSRAIPWSEHPEFGAFHTSEVPYVFGNLKKLERPWEAVDRMLSEHLMGYWTNFAMNGDPNGKSLPHWPAFDAKNPQIQRMDAQTRSMPIPSS
jgi:para-nitrobenzyl esterase